MTETVQTESALVEDDQKPVRVTKRRITNKDLQDVINFD